jgi:filamentous hemagglutinin family protein
MTLDLRWLAGLLAATASPTIAQIATDGTAGPAVRLDGPDMAIGAALGTRAGDNLFHSFQEFSIRAGQSATFSGPATVRNVIGRVTGGAPSAIDGTLRSTMPAADLWLLNLAGIVFGPEARLDLPGSLHVSTADQLELADGSAYSASLPDGSSFSAAAPEAFGFLQATPAPITLDRSDLAVASGETFSIVGGAIRVAGGAATTGAPPAGAIRAEGGTVNLLALAGPGRAKPLDGSVAASAGDAIALTGGAQVESSGDVANGVLSEGDAGDIVVKVDNLLVIFNGGAQIASLAFGKGDGGNISVEAGTLQIVGDGDRKLAGITASADIGDNAPRSEGNAGIVEVKAETIEMVGPGAQITSLTFSEGNAGLVHVEAGSLIIDNDDPARLSGVLSGARLLTDVPASGNAGTVVVHADRILVSGAHAAISSEAEELTIGTAGKVEVVADDVTLQAGGGISSASTGSRASGGVALTIERSLRLKDSTIATASRSAGGGAISIAVGGLLELQRSTISSSVPGATIRWPAMCGSRPISSCSTAARSRRTPIPDLAAMCGCVRPIWCRIRPAP